MSTKISPMALMTLTSGASVDKTARVVHTIAKRTARADKHSEAVQRHKAKMAASLQRITLEAQLANVSHQLTTTTPEAAHTADVAVAYTNSSGDREVLRLGEGTVEVKIDNTLKSEQCNDGPKSLPLPGVIKDDSNYVAGYTDIYLLDEYGEFARCTEHGTFATLAKVMLRKPVHAFDVYGPLAARVRIAGKTVSGTVAFAPTPDGSSSRVAFMPNGVNAHLCYR